MKEFKLNPNTSIAENRYTNPETGNSYIFNKLVATKVNKEDAGYFSKEECVVPFTLEDSIKEAVKPEAKLEKPSRLNVILGKNKKQGVK